MDCASCAYWYTNSQLKRKLEIAESDLEVYKAALELMHYRYNDDDRDYIIEQAIKKCVQEGRFKK